MHQNVLYQQQQTQSLCVCLKACKRRRHSTLPDAATARAGLLQVCSLMRKVLTLRHVPYESLILLAIFVFFLSANQPDKELNVKEP